MEEQSFGYWLRRKRKALDLTREGLAERVGCSAATIQKLEEEERRPSAQIAERLADIFNIPQSEHPAFLRFARGELRSTITEKQEALPWNAHTKLPRSNLPATVTSLIGREKEIAEVHNYLLKVDVRLVTLMGPPGIGKTRLSIEAARAALPDFSDGVTFASLATLDDPALITVTVAQAMGYVGTRNVSTLEQLIEGIGEKQMLIVLDNCEHLIEDVASLVSFLLSACSRLRILATSRESLRVPGEWLYPVPAFGVPAEDFYADVQSASSFPALALFAERAHAVRPDFELTAENIKTVSAICQQLDGLPLAIELIAARTRMIPPHALLERLHDQFVLTADGMRAVPAGQKSLTNAIDWSYQLLAEEEQKLFAYLSVFSGGFTLEAVEAIFSQAFKDRTVSDLIFSLLDKSLLQYVNTVGRIGNPTYTMLVTIQEFARQRLQNMGEEKEIRDGHLWYFLGVARKAYQELYGPKQVEWLNRLRTTRDNFQAALDWAIETRQTETALQIVRGLNWFWVISSDHNEARQWFHRVLEMPDAPLYTEMYAEVLAQLAHHTSLQIRARDAKPFGEKSLSIARAHKDKHNTARALWVLAMALINEENFVAAQSALEESQALFQEVQDKWGYAMAVFILGWSVYWQQNWHTALTLMEKALAIYSQLGDRYLMSVILGQIGRTYEKQGNLLEAEAAVQEALILAQQLDSKYEIANSLWFLGEVAQDVKNWTRAVHLSSVAKKIYDSIGAWQPEDDSKFESRLESYRTALNESALVRAMEEVHAMTMEQAVECALQSSTSP